MPTCEKRHTTNRTVSVTGFIIATQTMFCSILKCILRTLVHNKKIMSKQNGALFCKFVLVDLREQAEVNAEQAYEKTHRTTGERTVFQLGGSQCATSLEYLGYPTVAVSHDWRRLLLWFLVKFLCAACNTCFQGGHTIDFLELCTEGLCSKISTYSDLHDHSKK